MIERGIDQLWFLGEITQSKALIAVNNIEIKLPTIGFILNALKYKARTIWHKYCYINGGVKDVKFSPP